MGLLVLFLLVVVVMWWARELLAREQTWRHGSIVSYSACTSMRAAAGHTSGLSMKNQNDESHSLSYLQRTQLCQRDQCGPRQSASNSTMHSTCAHQRR